MSKAHYIECCRQQTDLPLFARPFWWDAQSADWDVLSFSHQGITSYLPFVVEKKWTTRFLRNPHLIPYVHAVWSEWASPEAEATLMDGLLRHLPPYDVLDLDLCWRQAFPVPNQGPSHRFKHTQVLTLTDELTLLSGLKPALKRQIKKAEAALHMKESHDLQEFLNLYHKTFQRQSLSAAVPDHAFEKAWEACRQNACGKLWLCCDEEHHNHAAIFVVFDAHTAYYLAGGSDPAFSGSGAMSGLMWHVITQCRLDGKQFFDFEGSMLPGVDRFFRNFAPRQMPYLNVHQNKSLLHKLYKRIKK